MGFIRRGFWKLLFLLPYSRRLYTRLISTPLEKKNPSKDQTEIHDFLTFAISSVPYYRENYFTQNKKEIHLTKLPILKKRIVKTQSNNLLADNYQKRQNKLILTLNKSPLHNLWNIFFQKDFLIPMTTGGTSGTPITCYKNKESLYAEALLFIRGWKMMGYNPGDKVLVFYNRYYDYDLSWANSLTFLHGIHLFFFDSLNEKVIQELAKKINTFKPDFIITFPSYISYAAEVIKKKKIKINHTIKGIEVSGETIFPYHRKNCEEIFQTKLYNSYGSIEIGNTIAHECSQHTGMHVFEDIVHMEEKRNKLVITRFNAWEMPFIRYEIGDKGKLRHERCPCGIEGLKLVELQGRIEDYIILPSEKRIYPSSLRQIINQCNALYPDSIKESKVIQNTITGIIVYLVADAQAKKKDINTFLINRLRKFFPEEFKITIRFIPKLPFTKKFRFIERRFKTPNHSAP